MFRGAASACEVDLAEAWSKARVKCIRAGPTLFRGTLWSLSSCWRLEGRRAAAASSLLVLRAACVLDVARDGKIELCLALGGVFGDNVECDH